MRSFVVLASLLVSSPALALTGITNETPYISDNPNNNPNWVFWSSRHNSELQIDVSPFANLDPMHQLYAVDIYVDNTFQTDNFTFDSDVYGDSDYWATPNETINSLGDCEDLALLKAAILQELGWSWDNMWLGAGLISLGAHAVLFVEYDNTWYILDNRSEFPGVLETSESDLDTIYINNFNEIRLYLNF